jgi:hypothetical protein
VRRKSFFFLGILVLVSLFYVTCDALGAASGAKVVTIWTDQRVVALYADYFNAAQDKYKAEIVYTEDVGEHLAETKPQGKDSPDIVIGNWLNSAAILPLFKPVKPYYQGNLPFEDIFYPRLLENGQVKNAQVLLPVSFDSYVLAFDRNNSVLLPDPFSITTSDIRKIGAEYNLMQNGVWTRIGFSPLWNENFLFLYTELAGVNWREGDPVSWDNEKLEAALETLRKWVVTANDSIQADDDFSFKYFYEPPDKLAASNRILFSIVRVSDFFKLTEERRNALDFRWLEHEGRVVPTEDVVYFGIYRNSASRSAAVAFTNWFYDEETQRHLLFKGKATRTAETHFGIADGFSAMRGVTESVFPQYYTGMLGHMPPEEKLVPPGVLPPFFPELKERVILPYLREKIRLYDSVKVNALELRLSDWGRTG